MNVLEGRVIGVKTHSSRSLVSEDEKVIVGLSSLPLEWVRTATIGPSVVNDLEDRVVMMKTDLNHIGVGGRQDLRESPVPSSGVGKTDDHRSVGYGRSRRPGRQGEGTFEMVFRVGRQQGPL